MDMLASLAVPQSLLTAIAEIDEFKGRWESLRHLAPERLSALKRIATIESVGSSTRIEGAQLSDADVDRLLRGIDISSFRSRDEQEVAGYGDLMDLIFSSYPEISLTENHIKQLHGVLLKYSAKDERHRGEYKKLSNNVEAFDGEGNRVGVIFETASPFDTPRLMSELVSWTAPALEHRSYHPILTIAAFVVRFLEIHPFQDGNGRLSRALTAMLLLRAGYTYVPYASLERVVEDNKDEYYRALRRAQTREDTPDGLLRWLEFFASCLRTQKDVLARKIREEKSMGALPALSEQILALARDHGRVTVRAITAATGANRNTIKGHLRSLVQSGALVRHGERRGAWYGVG